MAARWHPCIPFEGNPARRWVVPPVAVLLHVPIFLIAYQAGGSMAFGIPGFISATLVGAAAGVGPGIATGLGIQLVNFLLARYVEDDVAQPILAAAASFLVCTLLASATGGLRALAQHVIRVNRRLDEHIRARQVVEASLDESLQLHRSLLATLGEGVGLFDSDNRFVMGNRAAERLLGVSPEGLAGRNLEDFLDPESAALLEKRCQCLQAAPSTYELRLAGEEERSILVTETRMEGGESVAGQVLRVLRDETLRKRLEKERIELSQYLQRTEALQSLAVMAGGVAHDFNNLLSGVINGTELALLKLHQSPATAHKFLEEARQFAFEASELSRQMLAYAGKHPTQPEPLELVDELEVALRLIGSLVSKRAVLVKELPTDLPRLLADPTGFHQVVTNLVLNGLEAMPEGDRGTITIGAAVQSIESPAQGKLSASAPGPGGYVVVTVSDTGVGMSPDVLSHLFEPFFSTKFHGRGMGLAATLGIVRSHGGGIDVESRPGEGTTFRVYWPVAAEPSKADAQPPPREAMDLHDTTVLLVDDEAAVREVTGPLLEELGCSVYRAENGREALALFEQEHEHVDVVLLDLTMPEQSGLEVLETLRVVDPEVRVVLTSGFGIDSSGDSPLPTGVAGFVPKPHRIATLQAAISRALFPSATAARTGVPPPEGPSARSRHPE